MRILVHRDPQPGAKEPEFVKKAYAGLILEVSHYEPPGLRSFHPEGFYQVTINEFLSKLKEHNLQAYEWLSINQWGPIKNISDKMHKPIELLFPRGCCEEIGTIN